ncbi:MAG: lysostaphin resistance A-like protein [Halodesulfurarchaeum sp.]
MTETGPWVTGLQRSDRTVYAVAGATGVALGGILSAVVLTAIVGLGVSLAGLTLSTVHQFVVLLVAGALGLAAAAMIYVRTRGLALFDYVGFDVPSLRDLLWAFAGYVGALSLVFFAGVILTILQISPDTANQAAVAGGKNPTLLLWLVPLSFLVIAPGEELLFRGVVQGRLREAFRPRIAIPATAGLFAVIHYFSLTGGSGARFIAISILFFPSLVFGLAYERTRNLLVPILIHGAYNSTLVLLFYVVVQFSRQPVVPT